MNVAPVNTFVDNSAPNARVPAKTLSTQDFMKLMIVQLQNQDPMKPQDGNSMLAQMTQIGSMQSMLQMQQSLTQMGVNQQLTLGQSLLNRTIQVADGSGKLVQGPVTEVALDGTSVNLMINGHSYPVSSMKTVLPDPTPNP